MSSRAANAVRLAGDTLAGLDVATLHALADHLDEMLWIRGSTGCLTFVSQRSVALLGASPTQLLADPSLWQRMVPVEWQQQLTWLQPLDRLAQDTKSEYPLHTGLAERWVQESCFPVRSASGRLLYLIGATRDVTERHCTELALRLEAERAHGLALHDPLTGLLNRRGLEETVKALSIGADAPQETAVILIDCDDFKRVNDLHGHDAGDEVLRQVAARVSAQLRPTDRLGRLGGDEFLILLPHTRLGEAVRIAERITAVARRPFAFAGRSLTATLSIGAGMLPQPCPTIGAALATADAALLACKRIGKNRVVSGLRDAADIEPRKGGEPTRVRTLAQPICRLADMAIVAYETLSRGPHGHESIGILFSLAGLQPSLRQLDWLCIESSIAAAAELPAGPSGRLPLHVNVLPETALEVPVASWMALRASHPGPLVIEFPQALLVGAPMALRERLRALRGAGIRIAIDGFCHGRGSLEALLVLEPDIVKIDRHLVRGADRDRSRSRVLARMQAVTSGLDIAIVPVGIETEAERATMRELGFHLGQGFLFGRPTLLRAPTNAASRRTSQ